MGHERTRCASHHDQHKEVTTQQQAEREERQQSIPQEIIGVVRNEHASQTDRKHDPTSGDNDHGWRRGPDQNEEMTPVQPDSAVDEIAGAERCERELANERRHPA
jgi:hypothetical protein